jgi:hypothetical protein
MNEKTKVAMERLEKGLETLLDSAEWRKFLQFQATFHRYSFANTLLIMIQRPNDVSCKPYIELEAESTAFVVAHALGLDTSDYSFGYIAGWSGKEALNALKACGTRIQQAADRILKALEETPELRKAI